MARQIAKANFVDEDIGQFNLSDESADDDECEKPGEQEDILTPPQGSEE